MHPPRLVLSQHLYGVCIKSYEASTSVCLWRPDADVAAHHDDRLQDMELGTLKINVSPTQTKKFAPAESS